MFSNSHRSPPIVECIVSATPYTYVRSVCLSVRLSVRLCLVVCRSVCPCPAVPRANWRGVATDIARRMTLDRTVCYSPTKPQFYFSYSLLHTFIGELFGVKCLGRIFTILNRIE